MKNPSLIIFMVPLAYGAYARLGESPSQIMQRYGVPVKTISAGSCPFSQETNKWAALFNHGSFTITVVFFNGSSAAEYVSSSGHDSLTKSDAQELISLIGGAEGWTEDDQAGVKYSWVNKNGARAVLEDGKLSVATKEFGELAHQKRASRMDGF